MVALDPVEAEVRWLQEGKWIAKTVRTAHVWFVPAKVRHAATWRSTAAMLVLFVSRDYVLEECGIDLTEGTVRELGPLIQRDYLVGRFCRKFHELCHGKRAWSQVLTAASGTLLAAWLLRAHLCPARNRPAPNRGLSDDRLRRVTSYIDIHLREPLTRTLLARVAGQTEFHFSRMFKVAVGLPPMKYVWRCRIHRARQLLETGEWKVAAVAAETGYCDQSHLDRQFRNEFGCSPGSVIPRVSAI